MLSFMREQGLETAGPSNTEAARPAELPGTMPISASQQYLTVAHEKQVRKSNYLLFILFIIGLLTLWFMIKKSTPQAASAAATVQDTQIETLLAQFAGVKAEMFSSLDEIAERFYKFSNVQQVKNDELVKNPFKTEAFRISWQTTGTDTGGYNVKTETAGQSDSERYTGHMQLLSIMASDAKSCCMIDDRIVYEGDTIKGFTVREIGDNFVRLESQEVSGGANARTEIVLKLSE